MKQKGLLTIFLIVFIDLLGFGLILPLLPFIAEKFDATPFEIGMLAAAYSFFQFISAPIMGRLSDRFGRKKLLFISQIGSVIGFIFLGVADTLSLIFLSRIIDGITGGNISIAQAYMADITTPQNRAKGMGILGAAFGLGFIFGPAVGGFLSQWGFAVPAYFAAFIAGLAAISTWFFLEETVDTKTAKTKPKTKFTFSEMKKTLTTPVLGLLIGIFFLINLAFSGMQGTFALWTQSTYGWGPTETGYMFAYIGIMSVIMQLFILPRAIKAFGEKAVFKLSLPILALGLLGVPLSIHWGLLLIATSFLVLGNSLANPTIQSIASENVDKEEYGGVLGFLQSSASLGRIVGPLMAGQLFAAVSKDAPYIFSAMVILIALLIVQKYLPTDSIFQKLKLRFFS